MAGARVLHTARHRRQCSLVQDVVHAFACPVHGIRVAQVALVKLNPVQNSREVLSPPGYKIVERTHLVPAGHKSVRQMRANESGSAGNEIGRQVPSLSHPETLDSLPRPPQTNDLTLLLDCRVLYGMLYHRCVMFFSIS
jgi:hypothetical protein